MTEPTTAPKCLCLTCRSGCKAVHRDRVCGGCAADLAAKLADLPRLYALLEDHLEPRPGHGERVSGSRTPPLPVALAVLNLRAKGGMVTVLHSWLTDWYEILDWSSPSVAGRNGESIAYAVCKRLAGNLPWACEHHPAVDEFAVEVREIHALAAALEADRQRRIAIGECPSVLEDGSVCATALSVEPGASAIRCPQCQAEHRRDSWRLLGEAMGAATDGMFRSDEIAVHYGLHPSTVKRWAMLDRWRRTDPRRRPLRYSGEDAHASYLTRCEAQGASA